MEKMRFELLEQFNGLVDEKALVKRAFEEADRCRQVLSTKGVKVNYLEVVVIGDREYTRDFVVENFSKSFGALK
jgi:hypothetical protein